jgi:hypothetical protein
MTPLLNWTHHFAHGIEYYMHNLRHDWIVKKELKFCFYYKGLMTCHWDLYHGICSFGQFDHVGAFM